MSSFPAHQCLPSVPITPAAALKRLQTYLEATEDSPYLLPNATLQVTGPIGQGDAASNLVIHNIKRVEAGLRGEWLPPQIELDGAAQEDPFVIAAVVEEAQLKQQEEEGWQDLSDYQREQSIDVGEDGPRDTSIGLDSDEVVPIDITVPKKKNRDKIDKEARKQNKKLKRKQEKSENEKKNRERANV